MNPGRILSTPSMGFLLLCLALVASVFATTPSSNTDKLYLANCHQSSTYVHHPGNKIHSCDKAIDWNMNQHFRKWSCSQVKGQTGWWSAKTELKAFIRNIRIYNRLDYLTESLNDISISVDGVECASYKSDKHFSVKTFTCNTTGLEVKISSKKPHLSLCEVEVFGNFVDTTVKRLGCFADNATQRDFPHLYNFGTLNSPMHCLEYCRSKGFLYAGIQNVTLCHCGNTYGRYGKLAHAYCDTANTNRIYTTGIYPPGEIPDGLHNSQHNSLHKTALNETLHKLKNDGRVQRFGCYEDKKEPLRDLPIYFSTGNQSDPQFCIHRCRSMAYQYAGLQFDTCTCGNSFGRYRRLSDSECNTKCLGDVNVTCGAVLKNEIYSTGLYPPGAREKLFNNTPISDMYSLSALEKDGRVQRFGCFKDKVQRDLPYIIYGGKETSPQFCVHRCRSMAYKFAGLQGGNLCTCGNMYGRYGSLDESQCNLKCLGENSITCGGELKNEIYSTGIYPSDSTLNKHNEMLRESLYEMENDGRVQRIGCFKESNGTKRNLPYLFFGGNRMSPQFCISLCRSMTYRFAGLQNANWCACGNSVGNNSRLNDTECSSKCPGDSSVTCGAASKNEIFTTGIFSIGSTVTKQANKALRKNLQHIDTDGLVQRLGCYKDKNGTDKEFQFYHFEAKSLMDPQFCVQHCRSMAYKFAALENGKICACGNSYGRHGRLSDGECNVPCGADATVTCGAAMKNEIYTTGIYPPDMISNHLPADFVKHALEQIGKDGRVQRLGCFADTDDSDLSYIVYVGNQTSPQFCVFRCRSMGYKFAGSQSGEYCTCGNSYGRHGRLDHSQCNSSCLGELNMTCGGVLKNEIFSTGIFTKDVILKNKHSCTLNKTRQQIDNDGRVQRFGCYKEAGNTKLDLSFQYFGGNRMTPEFCIRHCRSLAYKYAGLRSAEWCDCGNTYERHIKLNDTECNLKCLGDASVTCGGYWKHEIFTTGIYPSGSIVTELSNKVLRANLHSWGTDAKVQRLGCYEDKSGRDKDLKIYNLAMSRTLTPRLCVEYCRSYVYKFAGIQNGQICACGNSFGRYSRLSNTECNVPCRGDSGITCGGVMKNDIYTTGIYPPHYMRNYKYNILLKNTLKQMENDGRVQRLGCYEDKNTRDLPIYRVHAKEMSPDFCVGRCRQMAYKFAGMQNGVACTCGNSYGRYLRLEDNECNVKCVADSHVTCGGLMKNEIYSTGILPPHAIGSRENNPHIGETLEQMSTDGRVQRFGCYEDKVKRDLSVSFEREKMSPQLCVPLCRVKQFTYAGLQGKLCFCGYEYGEYRRMSDSQCNSTCLGDNKVTCGGVFRNEIFSTGLLNSFN